MYFKDGKNNLYQMEEEYSKTYSKTLEIDGFAKIDAKEYKRISDEKKAKLAKEMGVEFTPDK